MPRNVSGTYSLPLPPVVPNTTIATTWANPTLDDIAAAITDSLSRSGNGGMSAPFLLVDGTEAAPALAFSSSPGSGMWLDVDSLNFSYQGVSKLEIGANSIKGNVRFTTVDGTVAAPAYSFTSDTDTGIARVSAGNPLSFVVDGVMRGTFKSVPGLHLGDESVDAASSSVAIYDRQRLVSALTTQYGLFEGAMFSTSTTGSAYGAYFANRFAAGAYVTPSYTGARFNTPTLGAGQTVTSGRGIVVEDMGGVSSTYGIWLEGPVAAGASRWNIYAPGAARSYFEGAIGIGFDPSTGTDTNPKLTIRKTVPAATPAWQAIDTVIIQCTTSALLQLHAGATGGTLGVDFSVASTRNVGAIHYGTSANTFTFIAGSVPAFTMSAGGNRSLVPLEVTGGITVAGGIVFTDSADLNVGGDLFVGLTASIGTTLRIGAIGFGVLGVQDGGVVGTAPNTNCDSIVVDGDGNTGMTFMGIASSTQQIRFGRTGSITAGGFSYSHSADVLSISAGAGTTRMSIGSLNIDMTLPLDITTSLSVNSTKVVGTRRTGWTAATGTATRTTFATGTVTLPVLAEHVKALIDDLIAHGLIGA